MTLLETVAAIALMGSLLVAMVVARSQLRLRWADGQQRLEALAAADTLLTQWRLEESWPRPGEHGQVAGKADLVWRVQLAGNQPPTLDAEAEEPLAQIIRLEVMKKDKASDEALASVELLLPPPPPPESESQDEGLSEGIDAQ